MCLNIMFYLSEKLKAFIDLPSVTKCFKIKGGKESTHCAD